MKSYEMAVKNAKNTHFMATTKSTNSHSAQLFRVIQSLICWRELKLLVDQTKDSLKFSFHLNHGTEMALIILTDDLHGGLALQLLDTTTAFDTANHNLIKHCLANMEICGTALKWLIYFPKVRNKGWCQGRWYVQGAHLYMVSLEGNSLLNVI